MQAFLEREPSMLLQHLGGGDGRWVIPRKRLGAEHVIDFIIGERDSAGWQAVELKSLALECSKRTRIPARV